MRSINVVLSQVATDSRAGPRLYCSFLMLLLLSNFHKPFTSPIPACPGRTHQCRGQLQALGDGLHIAGDNMYEGATSVMTPDGCQSSAYLALQVKKMRVCFNTLAELCCLLLLFDTVLRGNRSDIP